MTEQGAALYAAWLAALAAWHAARMAGEDTSQLEIDLQQRGEAYRTFCAAEIDELRRRGVWPRRAAVAR